MKKSAANRENRMHRRGMMPQDRQEAHPTTPPQDNAMPPTGKPDGPNFETLAKAIAEQGELLKQLADRLTALEARLSAEAVKAELVSKQADALGELAQVQQTALEEAGKAKAELVRQIDTRFTALERLVPKPPQPKPDPRIH